MLFPPVTNVIYWFNMNLKCNQVFLFRLCLRITRSGVQLFIKIITCLLYTSDAADDYLEV